MVIHKILIVTPNWFGDVLFLTPALRAIKKQYPRSALTCLVPFRCREVLKNNPFVDGVILYDDRGSFFHFIRTFLKVARGRFDKAYLFHRSKTKSFWMFLAGIKERIGYSTGGFRDIYLTRRISPPKQPTHRTDFFLALLGAEKINPDGRTPDFFPSRMDEEDRGKVFQLCEIKSQEPYVVVHAGGNWSLKRWPAEHFVAWIKLFHEKFDWKVLLCGTEREKDLIEKIAMNFSENKVISLCGKTTVGSLALIIRDSKFILSNDSGPIHLAASQGGDGKNGANIIGLFGPTDPELTGPLAKGCVRILRKDVGCEVPCYFRGCDYRVCMEWLSPPEVMAAVEDVMASGFRQDTGTMS